MDFSSLGLESWHLWVIAGLVLAGVELLAPGAYFLFLGAAAFATGVVVASTEVELAWQFGLFALFAILSVYGGWYFYREQPQESTDPMLNDRSARLIGQVVTVVSDCGPNSGRVRVGDGEWPARGENLAAGEKARISTVDAGILYVVPLDGGVDKLSGPTG